MQRVAWVCLWHLRLVHYHRHLTWIRPWIFITNLKTTLSSPSTHPSPSVSDLSSPASTTSSHSVNSPLLPSITPSLSLSPQDLPLSQIFPIPSSLRTDSTDFMTGPFLLSNSFFQFLHYSFWFLVADLSWLFISFWVHVNIDSSYRIIL